MIQRWQLLCILLVIITGNSCYIGPEFQSWDLDEDNASAKIGMPLFIIPAVPAAGWEAYSFTQNVSNLEDGYYRVFECFWTDRPKEWVVYRRTGNSYFIFRLFTNDFSKQDFNTIPQVEAITGAGSLSTVVWIPRTDNIVPPLIENYRVYDCLWRNGSREWVIIREIGSSSYEWGRMNH